MEYAHPESLVSPSWLVDRQSEPRLRVIDARFEIRASASGGMEPRAGRHDYDAAHIPGAVFVDLMADLSHPEAPLEILSQGRFAALMGRLGIGSDTTVVVYDGSGGCPGR